MNFFNENNIIFVALNKIGDIILANLLFILCSIPLVTIGPSLTALYHCMLRTVKGNNNGTVKTFFRAFRQSFRQSLIVWLGLEWSDCCCFSTPVFFYRQVLIQVRFFIISPGSYWHLS